MNNNYSSIKTKFINKLYEKFHEKDIEEKTLKRNKKYFLGNMGHLFDATIVYKYKYHIFENDKVSSEKIFHRFINVGKRITKKQFLKNFEIVSYRDSESFEDKKNTNDTIYYNKYLCAFLNFYIESGNIFIKLSSYSKAQEKRIRSEYKGLGEKIKNLIHGNIQSGDL